MKNKIKWIPLLAAWFAATVYAAPPVILCTVFPIYQITRNVTEGREGVRVELLLPASLGCPHNYALTPQDMRKLIRAEVLVVNGLGLEEFLGAPVAQANPGLHIIDSAAGLPDLIMMAGRHHPHASHDEACADDHDHSTAVNPHPFASPRMSAQMARTIARGLSQMDPDGAERYAANAAAYVVRMDALATELAELGRRLPHPRIIQPHGVFDYFARDGGLGIAAVLQPHGQEPSAAEMIRMTRLIREQQVAAVIVEPQYSSKAGQTIARETGIPVIALDPGASGPDGAPLDHFDTILRQNIQALRQGLLPEAAALDGD